MRIVAGIAFVLLGSIAFGDDDLQYLKVKETYWSFEVGFVEGKPWVGSEDARIGSMWQVSYVKPIARFRFRSNPAEGVFSAYYMPSRTSAFDGHPSNTMYTYGLKVGARYWNEWIPGVNTFFDLGWGLAYAERTTQDLPNQINSTPYFGVGVMSNISGQEYIFSIRWHHMSNAGTGGDNQGFNGIVYSIGVKF